MLSKLPPLLIVLLLFVGFKSVAAEDICAGTQSFDTASWFNSTHLGCHDNRYVRVNFVCKNRERRGACMLRGSERTPGSTLLQFHKKGASLEQSQITNNWVSVTIDLDNEIVFDPKTQKRIVNSRYATLPGSIGSGDTAGSPDYYHLVTSAETLATIYKKKCDNYGKYASKCCSNPRSCAEKPNFADSDLASGSAKVASGLLKFQTIAEQFSARGTMSGMGGSKMCVAMRGLNLLGSGINIGLAGMCGSSRKKCVDYCEETEEKVLADMRNVFARGYKAMPPDYDDVRCRFDSSNLSDDQRANLGAACGKLLSLLNKSSKFASLCEGYKNSVITNVASSLMTGAMAQKYLQCSAGIKTPDFGTANNDMVFNGDCISPANMSNPICIKCNSNPEDAACASIRTMGLNDSAGNTEDDSDDLFNDGLDGELNGEGVGMLDPDMPELSDWAAIEAEKAQVNPIAGSGSGGPTGGEGNFGSGGDEGAAGAPGPSGLNTDILTGERGGGGYSPSSMSMESGGGGGFSGYGGHKDINPDNGMDMVQFMDKITKKAIDQEFGRKPASAEGPKSYLDIVSERDKLGIGFKHDNIFAMMKRLQREICFEGKVFSCRPDYKNFNYYRHAIFWIGVQMNTLNHYMKKGIRHPTKTEMWLSDIVGKEQFLIEHWDKTYKKKFDLEKFKKGIAQRVDIPTCHYDDDACIKKKYRPFVYIGAPEVVDRHRVPLIAPETWDPELMNAMQRKKVFELEQKILNSKNAKRTPSSNPKK